MPNALRGEVCLAGTDLVLNYQINAICELESHTDMAFLDFIAKRVEVKNPRFLDIRTLVWAGLRKSKPGITHEEAGDLMVDVSASVASVLDAVRAAYPAPSVEVVPGKKLMRQGG